MSQNRIADVLKLLSDQIPRIILFDTYLTLKERYRILVDVIECRDYDTRCSISGSYYIHQVYATPINSNDMRYKIADIDHIHPYFRDSKGMSSDL